MENEYGKKETFSIEEKILGLNYFLLIVFGILIFFVAGIIRAITGFDFEWIEDTEDNIRAFALIIMNIGLLIATIGFMVGAWSPIGVDSKIDIKIRNSMIVATGSCIIAGAVTNMILFM